MVHHPVVSRSLPLAVALAAGALAQSPADCNPALWRTGAPAVGAQVQFTLQAAPGCLVANLLALDAGPTAFLGRSYPIGANAFALPLAVVPASSAPVTGTLAIPGNPALAGLDLFQLALGAAPGPLDPALGPAGRFRIFGTAPQVGRVVVLSEHALDNGHSEVIRAAQRLGTTAENLTNDGRTTLVGNPWLSWSQTYAGDVVTLPMGAPGSEGMFVLPANLPFPLGDFVAGTVPQPQLDQVPGVMPVRNADLAAMVGQTFVAVVYDSSVGINYQPLLANLQGERCGRFAFTVLDVRLPGGISESASSTSFYDLVVRVEAPLAAGAAHAVPTRDLPADSVQVTEAIWQAGRLTVTATSALGAAARLRVSVDGFTFGSPMQWNAAAAQYEAHFVAAQRLVGRRVTVSSVEGGAYSATVQ